mmetsp:Transcript_37037/g.59469  ORF Transcript_37037/g.59469 Transcript_37037/m.59469 type:complete len:260 (-) Transcript_37037:100-879(-)
MAFVVLESQVVELTGSLQITRMSISEIIAQLCCNFCLFSQPLPSHRTSTRVQNSFLEMSSLLQRSNQAFLVFCISAYVGQNPVEANLRNQVVLSLSLRFTFIGLQGGHHHTCCRIEVCQSAIKSRKIGGKLQVFRGSVHGRLIVLAGLGVVVHGCERGPDHARQLRVLVWHCLTRRFVCFDCLLRLLNPHVGLSKEHSVVERGVLLRQLAVAADVEVLLLAVVEIDFRHFDFSRHVKLRRCSDSFENSEGAFDVPPLEA